MIDRVSEVQRVSWHEVLDFSIIEFFNTLCYAKDKEAENRRSIEKFKQQH